MALNFSRGSRFLDTSESSLPSSMRPLMDGYFSKNFGCFGNPWSFGGFGKELECNAHVDMIKTELGDFDGPAVAVVDDILDRLPRDPFGMDIKSTFNAISGWLQNIERDFESDYNMYRVDEAQTKIGDHQVISMNWDGKGDMDFFTQSENENCSGVLAPYGSSDGFGIDDGLFDGGFLADGAGEFLTISHLANWVISNGAVESQGCTQIQSDGKGGPPHDAMFFVLGYLDIQDVLSVEMVCKSLCDAVKNDTLLWRTIHIDQPLSDRITDEVLLKLADRAQGTLRSLSLVDCIWITDSSLKSIFESNPGLIKLSIPGCIKLTIDGILFNLRALKSYGGSIKHLRIGRLSSVTEKQFEELKYLLDMDKVSQKHPKKPRFYCRGQSYLTFEDDRAIDIEMCPRCQKLRLVYDCPAEGCQQKHQAGQLCRGCIMCIARCIHCGCCIKDREYEETFCLDLLCLDCLNQLLNCQETPAEKGSTKCTIISQRTTYQFCLYG